MPAFSELRLEELLSLPWSILVNNADNCVIIVQRPKCRGMPCVPPSSQPDPGELAHLSDRIPTDYVDAAALRLLSDDFNEELRRTSGALLITYVVPRRGLQNASLHVTR